jgi:malate synthase
MAPLTEIKYYQSYISREFSRHTLERCQQVKTIPGLKQLGPAGGLETTEGLKFLVELYQLNCEALNTILEQRRKDRKFMDQRVAELYASNQEQGVDFLSESYQMVLGHKDSEGRVVVGPKNRQFCDQKPKSAIAPLPEHLQGPHVTLFGPPDSAKMAINAMNAYHRKLKDEPPVIEQLLGPSTINPMWGADSEDSKTPSRHDLVDAGVNLSKCFDGDLRVEEPLRNRTYELAAKRLAQPIKRFPGLALPCPFLFLDEQPIPLHLYDFGLHLFRHWHNPAALTFYVPKLENEEEARYLKNMIASAEQMIQKLHPSYQLGTVRLMIVLENPRAILRTHEIIDELFPYFAGASLGWHDYLASMARLMRHDGNYRIPVKADPDIVIKYIKASHQLLADVVGSRGGVKVGGMYGFLPLDTELQSESFQITLRGFFKDVITQLRRDLTGFWVAHPDFVRLGMALVEAWKRHQGGDSAPLFELIDGVLNERFQQEVREFIAAEDVGSFAKDHPQYVRSLLVADLKESDFIANNHPDEIRYNVFQTLQYLVDWLSGNGCVALPTVIESIPVRVMDDLATAERSRWEVWHEIHHQRFERDEFLTIAAEEYDYIRSGRQEGQKITQVHWNTQSARWYPVAMKLMIQLMTAPEPVEFATELLLPFTVDFVRESTDPWQLVSSLNPEKYYAKMPPNISA